MADLVLYDGVCGLCSRLIALILKRDSKDRFRFAPLQSDLARDLLRSHGRDAHDLDTVHVVVGHGTTDERILSRGRAVIFVLRSLGGIGALAGALELLPAGVLDAAYRFVAVRRYRWFGRSDSCAAPRPKDRAKFLDLGKPGHP